jgi:putative thiamine transport system permease protein
MRARAASSLRYLPALTVGLFLGPVLAGLLGTLLPAFGYLPVLGGEQLSLEPWRRLLAAPGLAPALQVTLTSGVASTARSAASGAAWCRCSRCRTWRSRSALRS